MNPLAKFILDSYLYTSIFYAIDEMIATKKSKVAICKMLKDIYHIGLHDSYEMLNAYLED